MLETILAVLALQYWTEKEENPVPYFATKLMPFRIQVDLSFCLLKLLQNIGSEPKWCSSATAMEICLIGFYICLIRLPHHISVCIYIHTYVYVHVSTRVCVDVSEFVGNQMIHEGTKENLRQHSTFK